MSLIPGLLLLHGRPGSDEGGGDECEDDVGVVGGAGVLGLEVVLVCDLGEVDAGDIEEVAFVGGAPQVGSESAVDVVEASGNRVVSSHDGLHQSINIIHQVGQINYQEGEGQGGGCLGNGVQVADGGVIITQITDLEYCIARVGGQGLLMSTVVGLCDWVSQVIKFEDHSLFLKIASP